MKTRILIIVTIGIITVSVLSSPAFGLSCDIRTVQHQYDQNDLVFEGKVILKEYFPASEAALITFEIQNTFKGNPTDPLTLYSNEGLYGFKFREDKTYIVFAEKTETGYNIPLCVPVYHSFPSIVQGLDSIKQGTFGSLDAGILYEHLSEEEKNELEEIQEEESELRKIEVQEIENFQNTAFSVMIVGIFGGIPSGVFLFMRWRKRK